jgi:DNA processing protein
MGILEEIHALAILAGTSGLGPHRQRQLIAHYGSALNVLSASPHSWEKVSDIGPQLAFALNERYRSGSWQQELQFVERSGITLISWGDPQYPSSLKRLHDAPLLLYAQGALKKSDQRAIGIVGTRATTPYGMMMAEKLAFELAEYQVTIVSGLARGIDTAAHKGALKGGRTIAVLGAGLASIYPPENQVLSKEIAQNGALLSEYAVWTPPDRSHFPQRNRLVSGLAQALIVIEAPLKSGAMITAEMALNQGKPVFALPGRVDCETFQGNHWLIKAGRAKLIESGRDVLGALDELPGLQISPPAGRTILNLSDAEKSLLMAMPSSEIAFDALIERTGMPASSLAPLLMGLVLKRAVRELPGKIYCK